MRGVGTIFILFEVFLFSLTREYSITYRLTRSRPFHWSSRSLCTFFILYDGSNLFIISGKSLCLKFLMEVVE